MPHGCSARRVLAGIPVALIVVFLGTPAFAQPANDNAGGPVQSISANPFTLMFGWFNADYERRLTPNTTWGASGSYFSFDDFGYRNANAAFKYYPRAAMSGFYVGGRTGVYRVGGGGESAVFYGAGFELGYNWLLGKRDQVVVGMGAGVTRLFGSELAGASLAVPTLRLVNVGWTF